MQEFYVAATPTIGVPPLVAKGVLETLAVFEIVQVSPTLIQEAVDCSTVYSDDLNPAQTILGVKVQNPLAS